jgi:molybdopterin-guanine dinucleotide biosynthesis protein A
MSIDETLGCVLAGGLSRRMGGLEKAFIPLGGRPLLTHVLTRIERQVGMAILNANGSPERFLGITPNVVPDVVEGHPGPLAGVLTGMEWALEHAPHIKWVVTAACDTPFLPRDLVSVMHQVIENEGADMACAATGNHAHPVFGMWPVSLAGDLRKAIVEEGVRKVDAWTDRYHLAIARFPDTPYDPFFNTNRPEDIGTAQRILQEYVV